ncbi:Fic family protein [Lactococcus insecticola]|uniref:Fic family protein n=1 Tax=Pseudolactococcus insecticola TaxID=2709158 RepID=A0A6A0B5T0_9LACT|nr:Fic family protein [Lactococcus insecticola]GFH40592.1 Fic family protein [Lactococcus insecticola]
MVDKPPFTLTSAIISRVVDISELVGRLNVTYERNLHLRRENRLRAIQSSLAIEQNSLSFEQVTAIINGQRVLGDPQEIKEVKNAYEAYDVIMDYDPFSVDDFLRAHGLLTTGLVRESGHFRTGDVGVFDQNNRLIHPGARPQFVPGLINSLFDWAKSTQDPALIVSAVVHFEIETIHPFADGNGRMGRLWQSLILSNWQPLFAWLPVETIIYEHQAAYYKVLAQADQENDSAVFIQFMLDAIYETLKKYPQDKMSDILSDKTSDKLSKTERQFVGSMQTLLQTTDWFAAAKVVALSGKTSATVRRHLQKLVSLGVLEQKGERSGRRYRVKTGEEHE